MPAAHPELSLLIAVIGCDGSGKTTVSEEVLACIRAYGPAEAACRSSNYFGQGPLFAKRQFWVSA
jgi:uridine kinase